MSRDVCRAILIVLAMNAVHVGSLEPTLLGWIDRAIQAALAIGCVYFAIRSKPTLSSNKENENE